MPSGVESATPAITARTALDARKAFATSWVTVKIESTLQTPISAISAMTTRRRKLNVVRRRAATAGSFSASLPLVAV